MGAWMSAAAVGALVGLVSYALLRWVFWDIDIAQFGGLIGACALAGAGLTAFWLRRQAAQSRKGDNDAP
jgi:hypothetical protein